jgi:hypothetical protein
MKRNTEPEWLKLQAASAYSDLSVSELYRRCISNDIENVHMIHPGKSKGVRLISRKSLDAYIQSFLPGGSRHHQAQPAEAK